MITIYILWHFQTVYNPYSNPNLRETRYIQNQTFHAFELQLIFTQYDALEEN